MEETTFADIEMIRPDIFEQMKMDVLGIPQTLPKPTGLPMMVADLGTLAERAQMADIERETGVNINPYNVLPAQQVKPVSTEPQKTISYERAREIERQIMEERRKEALRRAEEQRRIATVSPSNRPATVPLPSGPSQEDINAAMLFRNR